MFTGLVECSAPVVDLVPEPPGKRLVVRQANLADLSKPGDSIAVSGCCLTVTETVEEDLVFQAGPETLARTIIGELKVGRHVNLERSLSVGDQLGGHYVTGHVDDVGSLVDRADEGDWSKFWFSAPHDLMRQMASKGSVAVDGVSLTIVDVQTDRFSVALIPHTLEITTLGDLQLGMRANLETDLLAKYVQRQLEMMGK